MSMDLTWEMLPQAGSLLFTAAFANGAAFPTDSRQDERERHG